MRMHIRCDVVTVLLAPRCVTKKLLATCEKILGIFLHQFAIISGLSVCSLT